MARKKKKRVAKKVPNSHRVNSLTEFTELIEGALDQTSGSGHSRPREFWYRGLTTHQYRLIPALYRHQQITDQYDLLRLEGQLMEYFISHGVLIENELSGVASEDLETLFQMQHYGVPTRLLDWTSNPYLGLYFALASPRDSKFEQDDSVVWMLEPQAWNKHALADLRYEGGPISPKDDILSAYRPQLQWRREDAKNMYEHPVAVRGIANSRRMFAQKGAFLLFGKNLAPMEDTYSSHGFPENSLRKFIIPKDKREELLEKLISIGFTDSVSYPDLHGLAMEIKRLHGFGI